MPTPKAARTPIRAVGSTTTMSTMTLATTTCQRRRHGRDGGQDHARAVLAGASKGAQDPDQEHREVGAGQDGRERVAVAKPAPLFRSRDGAGGHGGRDRAQADQQEDGSEIIIPNAASPTAGQCQRLEPNGGASLLNSRSNHRTKLARHQSIHPTNAHATHVCDGVPDQSHVTTIGVVRAHLQPFAPRSLSWTSHLVAPEAHPLDPPTRFPRTGLMRSMTVRTA
jgi:hypothetical protein